MIAAFVETVVGHSAARGRHRAQSPITHELGATMNRPANLTMALFAVSLASVPVQGQATPDEVAFVQWAASALHPLPGAEPAIGELRAIGAMIGDARIVALSESPHFGAEPLLFRNRLLEYLVTQKGFTVIAIESGLLHGRSVHDYVRGGSGALDDVMQRGFTFGFHLAPQNGALVRWLREYNVAPGRVAPVNFYGFDLSGAGDQRVGPRVALDEALAYLARVDSAAFRAYGGRLSEFLPLLRESPGPPTPSKLSSAQRDELTAIIASMISMFERREGEFVEASSESDYAWAMRAINDARQMDQALRARAEGGDLLNYHQIRDRAQADNIRWILEREGPGAKVLLYASLPHLSGTVIKAGYTKEWMDRLKAMGVKVSDEPGVGVPAGSYLRRRYGNDLVVIGNLVGGTQRVGCGGPMPTVGPPGEGTLAGLARRARAGSYMLDLRRAPAGVRAWLTGERQFDENPPFILAPPLRAFDIMLHMDSITPACR